MRLTRLLKNLVFRNRVEQDLDDELRAYVEMAADEKRGAGVPDSEARRAALVELGGVEQVRESVRDVRAGALLDQLRQDFLYAIRMLGRNRGFTAVAVTTLALGIGANTAIFSIVDTVVFRPLPYKDAGRLVKIWGSGSAEPIDNVSFPDFVDIRDQTTVFEQVAADDGTDFTVMPAGGPRQPIAGALVTSGWLSTLGVQPVLGRGFVLDDERPGNDRVVLLTQSYWRRHLASDPNIVGRTLRTNDGAFTVIGVLPPNVLRYGGDFLKPLVPAEYPPGRGHRDLDVFARLKPGVTLAQARTELETIARRLEREYPATNKGRRFSVAPLDKYYASTDAKANQGLVLMLGAVGPRAAHRVRQRRQPAAGARRDEIERVRHQSRARGRPGAPRPADARRERAAVSAGRLAGRAAGALVGRLAAGLRGHGRLRSRADDGGGGRARPRGHLARLADRGRRVRSRARAACVEGRSQRWVESLDHDRRVPPPPGEPSADRRRSWRSRSCFLSAPA